MTGFMIEVVVKVDFSCSFNSKLMNRLAETSPTEFNF